MPPGPMKHMMSPKVPSGRSCEVVLTDCPNKAQRYDEGAGTPAVPHECCEWWHNAFEAASVRQSLCRGGQGVSVIHMRVLAHRVTW